MSDKAELVIDSILSTRIPDPSWPVQHRCGPWCEPYTGPIRQGRPDPYDRTPVQLSCGHTAAPGVAHHCEGRAA